MASSSGAAHLDLLLQKAEAYSGFIRENQERVKAALGNVGKDQQTPDTDASARGLSSKKRKRSGSAAQSGKGKSPSLVPASSAISPPTEAPAIPSFQQPPNLIGGTLMPYQLEGVRWLLSLWENGLNGILADEMGLGKTIQIIGMVAHLRHRNTPGPYLIAGPLATISNWEREFKKWLPSCPVLLYHGDRETREALRQKHMPVQQQKQMSFPVVITSFEMCIRDRAFFERYLWQYIILDEGHRIKNRNCRLVRELKSIKSTSRLLLTGTPIQNSLEELWSLLNFCSPLIFDDLEVFRSWFDFKNIGRDTTVEDIIDVEQQNRIVTKMHEILRPFVLRRLKTETLGGKIPSKREVVVYCGMSSLQQEYYSRVLDGSLREALVEIGVPGAQKISLLNPAMNQRKVCNHPFLFGDLIDANSGENLRDAGEGEYIVMASGKFRLLHRMLPKLLAQGRKVLLFSQMTKLLDILEDYLHLQQHQYVRFDGTTKLQERQRCIDLFNDKDSSVSFFLLSTRAGGLGINLTAADTVILFDSDWNPHQDSQAQDRCHRIGQSENVVVYRLLTSGSVEIDMMKKQISKKKLERLTIHGGDYRKAGQRLGQTVTLSHLRDLLADDVQNIDRMDTRNGKSSSSLISAAGHADESESSAGSWIAKDISDDELNLIMDRQQLFSGSVGATSSDSSKLNGSATAASPEASPEESPNAVTCSSDDRNNKRDQKRAELPCELLESDEEIRRDLAELSAAGVTHKSSIFTEPGCAVPLEGKMYDVVSALNSNIGTSSADSAEVASLLSLA